MTVEQLLTTRRAQPFQPFTIRVADGNSVLIPHPDFLSMSPTGRTAVIFHEDGSASMVDLLLMTELELAATATTRG